MWNRISTYGRAVAAGLAVVALPGWSASTVSTASFARADDEPISITVTSRDIAASTTEAIAAHSVLVGMWKGEFRRVGTAFRAPKLFRYRGTSRTSCGVMPANNAAYCYDNNTIYFDDAFLAAQAKITGQRLGTDGDMAAVGIIAHEMGHAVAMQLGFRSHRTYDNEAVADCLAGAFARRAGEDGSLENGDLEEAFFGMAAAADPVFEPTGHERTDRIMAARLARGAHGTREQRTGNFDRGLSGGGGACLSTLAS